MFWYCRVHVEDGSYFSCVANAGNEFWAAKNARQHYLHEGEVVTDVEAEMFNTFEHGDPRDYELV